jgi:hypothetical protein
MPTVTVDPGVEFLLRSDEPLFRYRTLVELVGVSEADPRATEARAAIPDGPIVRTLLTDVPGRHPYSKWLGLHWRMASLMDLGLPGDLPEAGDAADRVLAWITGRSEPLRAKKVPVIRGLSRQCASIEGNALAVAVHFGHADHPRSRLLVEELLDWQWPDGGWNCDRHEDTTHASANESFPAFRGLAAFGRATADASMAAAVLARVDRAAEFFLRHRVAWSERSGRPMHPAVVELHYPPYWHYDVLAGLRSLAESGHLDDPRTSDALDLLEAKRRDDGTWGPDAAHYRRPGTAGSLVEVVDWGPAPFRGRSKAASAQGRETPSSEPITFFALSLLNAAGRLS